MSVASEVRTSWRQDPWPAAVAVVGGILWAAGQLLHDAGSAETGLTFVTVAAWLCLWFAVRSTRSSAAQPESQLIELPGRHAAGLVAVAVIGGQRDA